MTNGSLSFDRAADYYDATRSVPEEIDRMVAFLERSLKGCEKCLEVGIGTGRLALPLMGQGFDIVGVDLSRRMLEKMLAKSQSAPPVVQGDATALPFKNASFDAVYTAWVLHLITDWHRALDEAIRVVRAGPIVLSVGGRFGSGPWQEITDHFKEITGAEVPGTRDIDAVDDDMGTRGWQVRDSATIRAEQTVTPDEILRRLDEGNYSFTWSLDDATRRNGTSRSREWAKQRYGDLLVRLPTEFASEWRVYYGEDT